MILNPGRRQIEEVLPIRIPSIRQRARSDEACVGAVQVARDKSRYRGEQQRARLVAGPRDARLQRPNL